MTAPDPIFTRAEYGARLEATRAEMAARGIDALIVTDPANMNWLTGYDGWSFYVHQAVIVTADGGREPFIWVRPMDAPGAYLTAWIADENVLTYPEEHIQHPDHHPYETLARHLSELGVSGGRLGVEMDNYYFTARCLEVLRREAPKAEIVDADLLVNWRRVVKSLPEIALMEKAGEITAAMHRTIRETIAEGLPKHELVAEVQRTAVRGVPGAFGEYASIQPIAPSGREASASHVNWNDRPMARGEATYFEISGCHRRYHCPVSRTYHIGEPPADIMRAQEAVIEAIADAQAAARPGATCEAVARTVYESFAKRGFEKSSRTGYPIGLAYPPDWGEHTLSLRPGDATILEENMCFHLMPGLWTPDWGVAITESFVVTPDGGRKLADVPQEIFVVA